jgi:hypothetical protein
MSVEDYIKIIADKDEEIAALRSEIEDLKKQLESGSLEELVISDDSVTDNSDITLKVPEDENEGAAPDMNMSNLMNLMSMLMGPRGADGSNEDEEEEGEGEVSNEVDGEVSNEAEVKEVEANEVDGEVSNEAEVKESSD